MMSYLTAASDLGSFYLAAHPEVLSGNNSIHMEGTSTGSNTKIVFTYADRFIGV
jgi:hypothetical protein